MAKLPNTRRVALGGEPPCDHEDYTIITIKPMPVEEDQSRPTLNSVVQFLKDVQRVRILTAHISPLGLGLIKLHLVAQRDHLVRNSPYNLGQGHTSSIYMP